MNQYDENIHKKQTALVDKIGQSLIAATPEHWNDIVLNITVDDHTKELEFIGLESPEGHHEAILPPDEIYEYFIDLYELYIKNSKAWIKAKCRAYIKENGEWKINCDFDF